MCIDGASGRQLGGGEYYEQKGKGRSRDRDSEDPALPGPSEHSGMSCMFVCPQNPHVRTPVPTVMVLGEEALGR